MRGRSARRPGRRCATWRRIATATRTRSVPLQSAARRLLGRPVRAPTSRWRRRIAPEGRRRRRSSRFDGVRATRAAGKNDGIEHRRLPTHPTPSPVRRLATPSRPADSARPPSVPAGGNASISVRQGEHDRRRPGQRGDHGRSPTTTCSRAPARTRSSATHRTHATSSPAGSPSATASSTGATGRRHDRCGDDTISRSTRLRRGRATPSGRPSAGAAAHGSDTHRRSEALLGKDRCQGPAADARLRRRVHRDVHAHRRQATAKRLGTRRDRGAGRASAPRRAGSPSARS